MKVCLLSESFPPVIDGVVNVVMNYAQHLMQDCGSKVEVGAPRYPEGQYDNYPYQVIAYPSIDTEALANGYRTGNPLVGKEISELAAFAPEDEGLAHLQLSLDVLGVRDAPDEVRTRLVRLHEFVEGAENGGQY